MKKLFILPFLMLLISGAQGASILIPMDAAQANHLKAYGIAWRVLDHNTDVKWLLNYRGGSYLFPYSKEDEQACLEKGVTFETLPDVMAKSVLDEVNAGKNNTAAVDMQRAPRIAVYAPERKESWDDAVINALQYADIPFEVLYDKEVLQGDLSQYDWLHLHHEDFTGQHGRYYYGFRSAQWFKDEVADDSIRAVQLGYAKVQDLKLAVALKMKTFIGNGGFLFAMCTATDSYDIALAAEGVDVCSVVLDGDPMDPEANSKLNFGNCLAFENFKLKTNPYVYEFSSIDTDLTRTQRGATEANDYFNLAEYSVITQREQCMLVQNHTTSIKGFWGATTAFDLPVIKKGVDIMGANYTLREARYIHGNFGKGMWTFYGGHDPEDYQHRMEEPAPDLSKTPNSPGYRLILNNVMFQSTRTDEEMHSAFAAFPNPASSTMQINYTLPAGGSALLTIVDEKGALVFSQQLTQDNFITINVSEFATGNYFWTVKDGAQILHSDKFAVVH